MNFNAKYICTHDPEDISGGNVEREPMHQVNRGDKKLLREIPLDESKVPGFPQQYFPDLKCLGEGEREGINTRKSQRKLDYKVLSCTRRLW